jgi:hypothetical protein
MKTLRALLLLLTTMLVTSPLWALEPNKDGWYHTGDGVRVKQVAIITAKVYAIRHDMKCLPAAKSKQAVIDADCEKKFSWKMLRDVDAEKIQKALREAFQANGYGDGGKIAQFLGAINKEMKEDTLVSISYNAQAKTTSIWVSNGGQATVAGADFMKAVWSIWFGRIDQPSLGDSLISKL